MADRTGFVALAGRPNAGKSTFLNQVLGEKVAIVSDKPQTTRNRILGIYHTEGLQIGFLDLPGIHKPKHTLNQLMMRAVHQGLEDADLILHFIDVTAKPGNGDRFVHQIVTAKDLPVILVANKIDLVNKNKIIPLLDQLMRDFQPKELVPISALKGSNTARLLDLCRTYLHEGERLFGADDLTDQPMRFMAQELIREKILHHTREEIPHAAAVAIEDWTQTEDACLITAVIWVEKSNQRKIILGTNGQMISRIRLGAQRSLRHLVGVPVKLELFVKVQENWRDRQSFLGQLQIS